MRLSSKRTTTAAEATGRRWAIAISAIVHAAVIAAAVVRVRPRAAEPRPGGVMVSLAMARPTLPRPAGDRLHRERPLPQQGRTQTRRVPRPALPTRDQPLRVRGEEQRLPQPSAIADDQFEPAQDAGALGGPAQATSDASPGASPRTTSPTSPALPLPSEPQRRALMAEYLARVLRTRIAPLFKYPAAAERQGIEGRVILRLTVDQAGRILTLERGEPCPHEILCGDAAAMLLAAQPLPPPPTELGATIQLELPLTYRLD